MTYTVVPVIESVCAGIFGIAGAAAVAAPAILTAIAAEEVDFIANWAGDCVKDLLVGDGEFHPFRDGINIGDITDESSSLSDLLINSSMQ